MTYIFSLLRAFTLPSHLFIHTMKAIYQDGYSGTDFKMGELPDPTASAGEVVVRVHAAATNPIDIKRHTFMKDEVFPMIAGYDIAGVIEAVGEGDMNGLAVGDKVFGCVVGDPGAPKVTGAFCELSAVPASQMAKIPDGFTFEQMAALPVAVGTPMQAFDEVKLCKGEKIFISGGAGGVGIHAMQLAKSLYGASEVATTASEPKFEFVKTYGADTVVNYKTEKAGEVLKGWGDAAFDCTGEPEMAAKTLKEEAVSAEKSRGIVDFTSGAVPFMMVKAIGPLMERLANALKDGKFEVVIDKVYKFEDGLEAIKYQAGGRAKGKIIIKMI